MKTRIDLSKYEKMYDTFDKGHDQRHLNEVRSFALKLAKKYCPEKLEIVYVAATLHDIGLSVNREEHEAEGVRILKKDKTLVNAYNKEEIAEIYEAVKQHRASNGNPQSVVAKIISDSDKVAAGTSRVFQRAYDWGVVNLPQVNHHGQLLRAAFHLKVKFGGNGTGNRLYFEESRKKQSKTHGPILKALNKYDLVILESFLSIKI